MKTDTQQKLKDHGFRLTKVRVAILEFLEKSPSPVDAEMIKDHLERKKIKADMATIYRFLTAFHKENLIRRLEFHEGKYRYELAERPHHHHAVCENCGNVEDIEKCDIELIEKSFMKRSSFQVKSHSLEFFGLCAKCKLLT